MSESTLIRGGKLVNEGKILSKDLLLVEGKISQIDEPNSINPQGKNIVDARGKFVLPGMIDDQVHFREPGLTYKADIHSESRAAVAGGITSFMEMPNTVPQALTQDLLENKYQRAAEVSVANYSFFMGASNSNIDEVLKTNPKNVCGIKVFMGSSTGNMLVDSREALEGIFKECPMLVAVHCEDEATIRHNIALFREKYGEEVPMACHPLIRNVEACYKSSSLAVELAEKFDTRLHVLHLSTAKEMGLFHNNIPLKAKRITAEACVHHLWFDDQDYNEKGSLIKWNPAVKSAEDRDAIWSGVLDNHIDVIATDHAPHTLKEKRNSYFKAPSGGPLVQHALTALLEMHLQGKISLEKIVEKTSHAVADCFKIENRGYIREGFWADLVLVNLNESWTVTKDNVLYKCGWSPFEGQTFASKVKKTWVNGHLVYDNGIINDSKRGKRLAFNR